MKTSFTVLLLPAITTAHMAWSPNLKPMFDLESIPEPLPSRQTVTSIPTATQPLPTITATFHAWDPLISSASHLLDELEEHLHIDLRKRQGGVGATNVVAVVLEPVQVPPVTVYNMKTGTPRTYTQLFTTPLVPFPAPQAGTVGMGTIQGQIGVVKTAAKREEPSGTPGQVVAIRGREFTMS